MTPLAVLSPILAMAATIYLLKAMKLGNILKPSGALSMATAGAGKIMRDTGGKEGKGMTATKLLQGGMAGSNPLKRADQLYRWNRGGSKSRRLTGWAGRTAGRAARKLPGSHHAEKLAEAGGSKLRELGGRAATNNPLAGSVQARKLGALLAGAGAWALEEGGAPQLGEKLKPFKHANPAKAAAAYRESQARLRGQLAGVTDPKERAQIRARHRAEMLETAATFRRGEVDENGHPYWPRELGPDGKVPLLSFPALTSYREGRANELGVDVDALAGDAITGTLLALAPTNAKLPNVGNEDALFELSKSMHLWFDKDFQAQRPGESHAEWATRMVVGMQVKGGMGEDGRPVDMHQVLDINDTLVDREKLTACTDPTKEAPIRTTITFSAKELVEVDRTMRELNVASRLRAEHNPEHQRQIVGEILTTDIAPAVSKHKAVTSGLTSHLQALSTGFRAAPAVERGTQLDQLVAFVTSDFETALSGADELLGEIRGSQAFLEGGIHVQSKAAGRISAGVREVQDKQEAVKRAAAELRRKMNTKAPDFDADQEFEKLYRFVNNSMADISGSLEEAEAELQSALKQQQANAAIASGKSNPAPKSGRDFAGVGTLTLPTSSGTRARNVAHWD